MPVTASIETCSVLLFGPQADLAQARQLPVQVQPGTTTVKEVLQQLHDTAPALRPSLPASRLAVNHAVAEAQDVLQGSEELALIGLIGGG